MLPIDLCEQAIEQRIKKSFFFLINELINYHAGKAETKARKTTAHVCG